MIQLSFFARVAIAPQRTSGGTGIQTQGLKPLFAITFK